MKSYTPIPMHQGTTIVHANEEGEYIKTEYITEGLQINESVEGETIETKVERIMNNSEPIKDGAPTIYTERKDGVIPEYDIRTDRFDRALDFTDTMTKQALTKRKERQEERIKANSKDIEKPPTQAQAPGG